MKFELSDKQKEKAKEFTEKHYEKCGKKAIKATEGSYQFTYMFTPNAFGYLTDVRCNVCGEIKNITDTSNW